MNLNEQLTRRFGLPKTPDESFAHTIFAHNKESKMKRFLLANLFLLIAAASVAPAAMARGSHSKEVMDIDNNGVITL